MLAMVVFFIAFRWIHLSTPLIRLFLLVLILLLMPTLNFLDRKSVVERIIIPKLRLILILNSFLGSSDSLAFSELFHSLAPRPLAARSISDFLLTYLATSKPTAI